MMMRSSFPPLFSIKKAYRQKALELHPDRNINDVETAKKKFAEVQAAYDILSDPQERAWYDFHRDAILNGEDIDGHGADPPLFRNTRLTSTEEILSLIREFDVTIAFDDKPDGFFGRVRDFFEHLAHEEEVAAGAGTSEFPDYPSFGSAGDDFCSVVKPFYSCWAGFSTRKTFSWRDKHRLSDAPDRRARRLMEKENKKSRDEAIHEFNDTVGFLVKFVRKRDPRYISNAQTNAERQQLLRDVVAAQSARSRAANSERMESCGVPNWAGHRDEETLEHSFSESDEELAIELFECVACNKMFKSANQFEAHERSKKHSKAVQELRRQLQKEGSTLGLDAVHSLTPKDNPASRAASPDVFAITSTVEEGSTSKAETIIEANRPRS